MPTDTKQMKEPSRIIQPVKDIVALVVQGRSEGQTADLQQWRDEDDEEVAHVDHTGVFNIFKGLVSASDDPSIIPAIFQGTVGQTANLQQWKDSSGTVLGRVDNFGNIGINSAPNLLGGNVGSRYFSLAGDGSGTNRSGRLELGNLRANGLLAPGDEAGRVQFVMVNQTGGLNNADVGGPITEIEGVGGANGFGSRMRWRVKPDNFSGVLEGFRLDSTLAFGIGVTTTGGTYTMGARIRLQVNAHQTVDNLASVLFATRAATDKGLVIQGAPSQSADLQQWQSSSASVRAYVTAGGRFVINPATGEFNALNVTGSASGGTEAARINTGAAGNIGLTVIGSASQSGFLQQWVKSDGGLYAAIDQSGRALFGSANNNPPFLVVGTTTHPGTITTSAYFVPAATSWVAATFKGLGSQTGDLTQWQDSAGSVLARITSAGVVRLDGTGAYFYSAATSSYFANQGDPHSFIFPNASNSRGLVIRGQISQTANLQEWQKSDGTVYASINGIDGTYIGTKMTLNGFGTSNTAYILAGAATVVPLTVRGFAAQSGDLQQWQNSSSTVLSRVISNGGISSSSAALASEGTTLAPGGIGNLYGYTAYIGSVHTGTPVLLVRAKASQSANLLEWQDNAGVALAAVSSIGRFIVGSGSTPVSMVETRISSGQFWNQTTPGTFGGGGTTPQAAITITNTFAGGYDPVLVFRQATSTGTIKTSAAITVTGGSSWTEGSIGTQVSHMGFILRDSADTLVEHMRIQYNGLIWFRAISGQVANLQEWQSTSGTVLASVGPAGGFTFNASSQFNNGINITAGTTSDPLVFIVSNTASSRPLVVKGAASQSVNLQEWHTSAGNPIAAIDMTGRMAIGTVISSDYLLRIFDGVTHPGTSTTLYGIVMQPRYPATTTNTFSNFTSYVRTAASGNNNLIVHFYASGVQMSGGTVGNVYGFFAENFGNASVTNAYGIRVNGQSGSTLNVGIRVDSSTQAALWLGADTAGTTVAGGIAFGVSRDVTVYRSTTSSLSIDGNLYINTPVQATPSVNAVQFNGTFTGTATGRTTYNFTATLNPASGATGAIDMTSIGSTANTAGSNIPNGQTIRLFGGWIGSTATVAVNSLFGVRHDVINQGAGTVTAAFGAESLMRSTGGGVVTSGYGFYASSPIISGGGTFGSTYGVYVNNMGASGVTNAYGVWVQPQSGASGDNIPLVVGTTSTWTVGSDGSMGIGCPIRTDAYVTILNTNVDPSTNATSYAFMVRPTFKTNVTTNAIATWSQVRTSASHTVSSLMAFYAASPVLGATPVVTTSYGMYIENQSATGIANGFGLFVNPQSGAGTFNVGVRIDTSTTAALWLGGDAAGTSVSGGITFGSGRDISTYRSGTNQLDVISTGNTTLRVVAPSASASFFVDGGAGTTRNIDFSTAGSLRWVFQCNATAESGSNAGSDLAILARSDVGGALFTSILITRSTSNIAFNGNVNIDSVGRIATRSTVDVDRLLYIGATAVHPSVNTGVVGVDSDFTTPNTATTSAYGYRGRIRTAAAAFTLATGAVHVSLQPVLGVSSAITTLAGFYSANQGTTNVANAYGLLIDPTSGASTLNVGARIDTGTTAALWLGGDASGTTASGGIVFGATRDTNLYRSAADTLKTDDAFIVVGWIQSYSGVLFGSAGDTNLYRSAADNLKTDDAFIASSMQTTNAEGFIGIANSGGRIELKKQTVADSNPGTDRGRLYLRDGTNVSTLKLVVRAGASGAETTILDNIPT